METEIKDKTLVESILHVSIQLFTILSVLHCLLFVSSEIYRKEVKLGQKNRGGKVWVGGCQILWG
jgi:hypothetical protein